MYKRLMLSPVVDRRDAQKDVGRMLIGTLSFDVADDGFITVAGSGLWTPERTAEHFRDLERAVLAVRREGKQVRVLVDLRAASVQTAETAAIMQQWTGRIYKVADRVAVVCATALLAMQIKRAANIETLSTFHEIEPAKAWIRVPA